MKKFEVYAHSGGGYPPNYISTFRYAGALGVDGVEADICLTYDGEPIIYHPGALKPPEPMLVTWKQLSRQNYRIPHLDDLLGTLSFHERLKCLLDIKLDSRNLMEKVIAKIMAEDFRERVFITAPKTKNRIIGFYVDAGLLEYARTLDNRVKIHIIDALPLNMAETARKHRADMVSFGWLNESLASQVLFSLIFKSGIKNASLEVEKAQTKGARVMSGIANTHEKVRELLTLFPSIDAIMTDNPEMALSVRDWRPLAN